MYLNVTQNPFWSTVAGQFTIEIIGGTISSLVFLFLLLLLFKPKIRICGFLTKEEEADFYRFKFVNVSFFSAYDVKVDLQKLTRKPMGNGRYNKNYETLGINNGDLSHIPQRTLFFQAKDDSPHCILVRSTDDLKTILSDSNTAIILQIRLKHGLTGLSKVFEKEYANIEDIKPGKFKPGTKFEIL